MKKKHFPVYIDLSDDRILVVGGGKIALRRVKKLLDFCEDITVVSPVLCEELLELSGKGKFCWIQEEYSPDCITGMDMVLTCTNAHEVNEQVRMDVRSAERTESRHIYFNTSEDQELCDFFFPALVQTDDFVIGISSNGASPAAVKKCRQDLELYLNGEVSVI